MAVSQLDIQGYMVVWHLFEWGVNNPHTQRLLVFLNIPVLLFYRLVTVFMTFECMQIQAGISCIFRFGEQRQ
ncbi:hypothetical protein KUIN1_12810 [Pseudomonas sp. KUIN-1]|nr:hypothetical protein KUIN1_12810 [Pseudomonas sp. KUIN-1]